MNKPISMSLVDFFIKKTALKTLTSESTVEAIIKHQWKAANEGSKTNNEVEISGIGMFYVSANKTRKRIIHLEKIQKGYQYIVDNSEDEKRVAATKSKLVAITDRINQLKDKLND